MNKRLNEIIKISQQQIPSSFHPFQLSDNEKLKMMQPIKDIILAWNWKGAKKQTTEKNGTDNKVIFNACIQWFIHHNGKIYGNYLFYPLFLHILKVYKYINTEHELVSLPRQSHS